MISATEALKISEKTALKVKETEEFKYAMMVIEKNIKENAKAGRFEFSYNKCALVKNCEKYSPSSAVLAAIKHECEENGYYFTEYYNMNRAGFYNSCFKVSW